MRQASKNQKAATKQLSVIEKSARPKNLPSSKPTVDPSFLKKVQRLPEAISLPTGN
jgi:hypothetical protein